MSCWVVPSVASEYLQKPVDLILNGVDAGEIPSQTINGFLFVDVAPDSPVFTPAARTTPPPTFVAVSDQERATLDNDDDSLGESDAIHLSDWRCVRDATSALRIRPAA